MVDNDSENINNGSGFWKLNFIILIHNFLKLSNTKLQLHVLRYKLNKAFCTILESLNAFISWQICIGVFIQIKH